MGSPGFQRFVAGFVGVLLILAVVFAVKNQDESLLLTAAVVAILYGVYLNFFLHKEKERRKQAGGKQSPLIRK